MVIFYKKWKKYNEIQLTKNKMDLNIRKMTNHPPSPGTSKKTQNPNLQASDWVHCEEETGTYYQLYRHTYKLVILFKIILYNFI